MKPFYVYLLRCSDGSYYCGQTDDLDSRMLQHEHSSIGYTATRKPVTLVWKGEFERREDAIAFERRVKGWSRVKKEALVAGDWGRVSELARSRQTPFDKLRANGSGEDTLEVNGGGDTLRTNGGGETPKVNGGEARFGANGGVDGPGANGGGDFGSGMSPSGGKAQ